MKWMSREHPKINRLACPWLMKRFIDKEGEIVGSNPWSRKA